MFDSGFFGNLFDLDGDGKLSSFEKAADLGAFLDMVDESENDTDDEDSDKE